jgi:MFS family permease
VFAGIFGIASVVGPVVGGYLTDNLTWRWVFYVNVPVGIAAIVAVFLTLPSVRHSASWRDIDFAGAFTLAGTLVPLLIALSITRDHEFTSPEVLGLLLVAAVMGAIFFIVERRTDHPVVPFDLWKNPTFSVSTAIGFLLGFAMFGAILFVGLVYQGVLGMPATNSGLLITPLMAGLIVSSIITGQLMVRMKRYRYLGTVGAVVLTVGLYLLAQVTVGTPEIEVVRDLVLIGLGVGVGMPLYLNATQSAVDQRYLGVVSSQIQFWRNIGSTVGVAILGAVLSHELTQKIVASIPPQLAGALPANGNAQAIFDPAVMQKIPPAVLAAIRGALASSLHDVFLIAAVVASFAVVISLFLQEVPLRGRADRVSRPEVAPAFGD